MSGIPRYNNAPLNARSGVADPAPSESTSTSTSTATSSAHRNPTTTSPPRTSYARAQPAGVAAAVPRATELAPPPRYACAPANANAGVTVTETQRPPPTRTIKEDSEVPATPQPGALPMPPTGFAGTGYGGARTAPPAPPRAGLAASIMPLGLENVDGVQKEKVHGMNRNTMGYYPPQMAIPPPSVTRAPFSSTLTMDAGTAARTHSTMHMHPQPVSVGDAYAHARHEEAEKIERGGGYEGGYERRSLEHPPGYVQNAYAAELSSDQRRAMEGEANRSGGLGLGMGMGGGEEEEGIWGSAKRWVGSAGSRLSEGEKEVWRRINGQ
ncbi:hypothetical protein SBOR_1588 [Sclerotinia borealis F-4128]|uniref:Uncharacterized protein n=1 Tax=Sclerotinia borealis (strain F-4128) TaxID=1432307 RepID=W9CMN2_SCLBF|nr:hypothetical protein SBOR_1588 [Sclerotinia borealis F-4128]